MQIRQRVISYQDINDGSISLHYEVEDTGQGIKEEDMGKLFQSYSQVNQEENHHKEGTGLGLTIWKQSIC